VWFVIAYRWVKKNIWPVVAAFGGGLAVIFGIALFSRKKKTKKSRDEFHIQKIKNRINDLRERGKSLGNQVDRDEEAIQVLMRSRDELKAEIEVARDTHGMTDDEVLDAFEQLGY
jgi:chromosome segregation ATPase